MAKRRFSRDGEPATEFEHQLLAECEGLEDPWRDIALDIGLDAALKVMDRFQRCQLSVPQRSAFVARMHSLWLDTETLRLRRLRPRPSNTEIAHTLGIRKDSIRKRTARALKRVPPKRA